MNDRIEILILKGLIHDEEYCRKVLPFIKEEYFDNFSYLCIFKLVSNFINKHNALPTIEAISIMASEEALNSEQYKTIQELIITLSVYDKQSLDWFVDQTEKFCKDRSIINAFKTGISIIDGKDKTRNISILPDLMKDALSVSFDTSVGHSYVDDAESRFDFYHSKVEQLPFDIEILNKITNGGVPKKSLNLVMAGCVHPDTKVKIRIRRCNAN
jgi:hypothetical protein